MKLSRRRFVASTGIPAFFPEGISAAESKLQRDLRAWLDTLYPADEVSPAATELNVHLAIEEKAESVHNYSELLRRGTAWADEEAAALGKTGFAELDEAGREKIVSTAEAMEATSVPGMFLLHTLRDGALFYYGHEAGWAVVGYPHPPQPVGFPDYSEPPEK